MITKIRRVGPVVLTAAGALLFGIALSIARFPAHAATTTITVTGTGDTTAGCTTTCASLRDAVDAANLLTTTSSSDVVIVLPSGTINLVNGELDLGSSSNTFMTIKGPSPGNPAAAVVNQQSSGPSAFVVLPGPGITTKFQDLTITGATADNVNSFGGAAILSGDTGDLVTLTNCVITGNSSTASAGGGGVLMAPGGSLTITNSTISDNHATQGYSGGVGIFNDGSHGASVLTITSSTVTGNSATDGGGVNPFGGGVFFDGGGNGGSSFSIARSVFSSNTAGTAGTMAGKGGAIYARGPGSITLSTFTGNQVFSSGTSGRGGAVWHDAGALTLGTSRIVGNTGTTGAGLYQDTNAGSITADNDWWGANTGAGGAVAAGTGPTPTTPHWLQLRHVPTTVTLHPLTSTTLTGDLLLRNDASVLSTGTLNGLPTFAATFGNAVQGTLSNATQFVNGVATATISAGTVLGAASADVTADNQTVTANLTVKADTTTTVGAGHNPAVPGQGVQFTATVTSNTGGTTPATPQGGTVQFSDEGGNLGAAVAVVNGVAGTPTISNLAVGTHPVTATYSGDADFNGSAGTLSGGEVVNKAATSVAVGSSLNPSAAGQSVTFSATVTVTAPGTGTPGGTVQFRDNGTPIGSAQALDGNGVASVSTSSLTAGTRSIGADYGGSGSFATSTATLAGGQVVAQAATSLSLASSANPSKFGQGVDLTATVTSGVAGTITGNVQFFVDGTNQGGNRPLSGGSATLTGVANLAAGAHSVTATYGGDASYGVSSATLAGGQVVQKADTSTTAASSPNPSNVGGPVGFTATVTATAPGAGTPSGNVQFFVDGSSFGSAAGLDGSGVATLGGITSLTLGTHPVTATYLGDAGFNPGTSPGTNQVVSGFATTTTVASAANPSVFGQPVSFTATVDSGGNGTPGGTVQFAVDGADAGSPVSLSGGAAASAPMSDLAAGNHTVTATYGGGSSFGGSTGSLSGGQAVDKAGTTTTVASSADPSAFGQPVTFTASVAAVAPGAGTPTGEVQFFVDGSSFGTPVALTGGAAVSGATSSLAAGTHPVTATYAGDAGFNGGASPALDQVVGQINATTVVTSTVYPSAFGQPVTFTATVTGTQGTPTGSIQFGVDGVTLGSPVSLTAGVATSTATASLAVGVHSVTATYGGDAVYRAGGSGFTQLVKHADTRTTVGSSANPSEFGESVHFTATVAPVPPGAGTAGGAVQFVVDGSNLGDPVTPTAGVAGSDAVSTLGVGPHTVMANYLGDASFNPSGGSLTPVGQVVGKSDSSTAVSSSQNPSAFGQAVQFTAQVSAAGTGAGTPDGTVQFVIDGLSFGGPVTLSGGSATSGSLASLPVGSHTVRADYNASANFNAGSGTLAGGQAVTTASTATSLASSRNPSTGGDEVQFTATVVAVAPGAGEPDGTVQFVVDGASAGSPVTLAGGVATYSTTTLTAGTHTVAAAYRGSAGFAPGSGTLPGGQTVASPAMADLSVTAFGPPRAVVGLPTLYAVGVTNNGPDDATGVVVSDDLPAGWTALAELSTQGSCSLALRTVTCTIGNLAAGAQVGITLVVVPQAPGSVTDAASVTGDQGDAGHGNNTSSVTTVVRRFGYWLFGSDGGVFAFGDAGFFGSTSGMRLNRPVAAMTSTPSGSGYWLSGSDGGVFAFGDAGFFGSTSGMPINAPIVALASTPTGRGYWLFGSDGGVFAFGDAGFYGSAAGQHLGAPIAGMAATPTGKGYWLVGADSTVEGFGDAQFFGSPAGQHLGAPIAGMAATPTGKGYWLVRSDGAVEGFGDAPTLGSLAGSHLNSPIKAIAATADGQGYWLVAADGGVFSFGDAPFLGSLSGRHLNQPIGGLVSNG